MSSRKHTIDAANSILSAPYSEPKRKRLTRSVFGSTVDIPIVLSDSESDSDDSESESDSITISSSTSKKFKKKDTLDQVITNGRIIKSEKKKSMGLSTKKSPKKDAAKKPQPPGKPVEKKVTKLVVPKIVEKKFETPKSNEPAKAPAKPVKPPVKVPEKVNLNTIVQKINEKSLNGQRVSLNKTVIRDRLNAIARDKEYLDGAKKVSDEKSSESTKHQTEQPLHLKSALKSSTSPPSSTSKFDSKRVTINENPVSSVTSFPSSSPSPNMMKLRVSKVINDKENNNPNHHHSENPENPENPKNPKNVAFDPKTQKPYRDIYSVCCISCQKKKRSEYCNRQQPCDICVGKKLKDCTYPPDAKVILPARFVKKTGSRSGKYKLNSSYVEDLGNSDEDEDEDEDVDHDHFEKDSIENRVNSIISANENIIDSDSSDSSVDKIEVSRGRPRKYKTKVESEKARAAQRKKYWEKAKKKSQSSRGDDIDDIDELADYENEEDDDDGIDDDDDENSANSSDDFIDDNDDDEDYRSRRSIKTVPVPSSSSDRDFEKAQRILKELAFEKRDINDIYVPNTRQRRTATKENYYIPSEGEEGEEDPENGYAAAEARNEQLILSEDEQERRMLRGEMDREYINSLRREMAKKKIDSGDSLSSDDDF